VLNYGRSRAFAYYLGCGKQTIIAPRITLKIVQFYTESSPSAALASEMSKSLHAFVTRRKKVVAHNEMIDRFILPHTSWADIEQLMSYEKGFIVVVGIGYMSKCFADNDEHYFLTQNARYAARVLNKLLEAVGCRIEKARP